MTIDTAPQPAPGPVAASAPRPAAEPAAAPTVADLLAFARQAAADPALLARLETRPQERTWFALQGPAGSEAWVIGWPPGAETGWHDHGGSIGAFVTGAGALREYSFGVPLPSSGWNTLELLPGLERERELSTGLGRAFGPHHLHQVVNPSATEHAVSVHVYYPPLPSMRRYLLRGRVLQLETVETSEQW